jgi:hypothetical protein
VEIYNHFPDGTYGVFWEDNCGTKTHLGLTLTTIGGTSMAAMPPPSSVEPGFRYLCPPAQEGQTYEGTLSTSLASTTVSVFVPSRPPDLTIDEIVIPDTITAGHAITVGVIISSMGPGVVSDTFDVDLYVNPSHTPVLKGQLGQNTAGGSSPKQWQARELPQGSNAELSYVVLPPSAGDYELWAQVDTSDRVSESNEENNILGPIEFSLFCSEQCDNFDPGPLDAKWSLAAIGGSGGSASPAVTDSGVLQLEGTGRNVEGADDGKSFMLQQGAQPGDWEMTVKVLDYPGGAPGARAGLMMRESADTGARYAAIAVAESGGGPGLQVLIRDVSGEAPALPCGTVPLPGSLFDAANGKGIYLRIARDKNEFTMYSSPDGQSWHTEACMQHQFSDTDLPDTVLPGIWFAPSSEGLTQRATYDRFRLCALGASGPKWLRPKPPLLRECGNVLLNSDLEPAGNLGPWRVGDTPQAVRTSTDYSADKEGKPVAGHSMQFRLDGACPGDRCQAWASQAFVVPSFGSATRPSDVELRASLFSLVPPPGPGIEGRVEDKLWVVLQDDSGVSLTEPIVVLDGGRSDRGTFHPFDHDLASLFEGSNVLDQAGKPMHFRLYASNGDGQGSTWFHLDQIQCDVCTTVSPPEPKPDRAYRLSGRLLVILDGIPTPMPGVDVWAIQLPDGTTPPEELESWTTQTIQDSTYNIFNLRPGRYRIYAEAWVSGSMYSAATTIQVEAGAGAVRVNLNLL